MIEYSVLSGNEIRIVGIPEQIDLDAHTMILAGREVSFDELERRNPGSVEYLREYPQAIVTVYCNRNFIVHLMSIDFKMYKHGWDSVRF